MRQAEDPSEYADALAYRDGLIISYLALHPVRLRNLENFRIGENLVRSEAGYMVTFAGTETKNGSPLEFSLAEELVEAMDEYLKRWRPALIARNTRKSRTVGSSVWVSSVGSPLGAATISHCIRLRTRKAFGRPVNPHSFRNAAATTVAIATPLAFVLLPPC
jgi:integrase